MTLKWTELFERRNLLITTFCIVFLAGCSGGEEELNSTENVDDWQAERIAQRKERKRKADEEKENIVPIQKKDEQQTIKPQLPAPIVSPIDRFQILEDPAYNMSLQSEQGQVLNRNEFRIVSEPEDSVVATAHRLELPDEPEGPAKDKKLELPDGFDEIKEAGYSESGWPLRIRCLADQSEMVFLAGGLAQLGTEEGPENARPTIRVSLSPFYMDMREVTVSQYNQFRESRLSDGIRIKEAPNSTDDPQLPVLGLSYTQARVYCLWAGKLLPNEAQWEYAARGNSGAQYPWRSGIPLWQQPHKGETIFPVGTDRFDRTPEGIFDLADNALEWCNDWYYPDTYQQAAQSLNQPIRDFPGPGRPADNSVRVVKGGGDWSAWNRQGVPQTETDKRVGFRGILLLSDDAN
ncbi:MAG: SUMF1/EgtB/PvdO family nonheme iron enzyme [Planctomycetaceae bacterium]|nr:SUMF1/EgtB/PvdO family nonheme iron enzyme [Planctomycetaceae bacterium]